MAAGTEHIDRHKIAAVMLKAIMEVYPVRISVRHILRLWRRKEPLAEKYIYANETLALYTALSIVENFSACTADGTPATAHSPITLPATFNDSHYDLNTYIDLYFSKRTKQINILTFANVFFLLEKLSKKENC